LVNPAKPHVIGSVRDALSAHGARLMPAATNADIIVEPRSGVLSTDSP